MRIVFQNLCLKSKIIGNIATKLRIIIKIKKHKLYWRQKPATKIKIVS